MGAPAVRYKIVVVDDERPVLLTLEALLTRHGYEPQLAHTATAGLAIVRKSKPDLVLLDLGLPDADGLDVLKELKAELPQLPVIILTANDSLSNAVESIKQGAFHFISKPYAVEELLSLITRAIEQRQLQREAETLREEKQELSRRLAHAERQLAPVAQSRSMRNVRDLVERFAPTDANVLLLGESGVGKEVVANQVHRLSRRADGPMVKLNCAAFPANMIEGELFGYVKGAFTGAVADFPGMIAQATGGTLFLDEIAEMPVELQTRFLRVLQEREFRRLGSTKTIPANFRLVAATNRNAAEAVRNGTLRQDLYYRLNTFQIEIPALRERREDIPALVAVFLARFAKQMGKPEPTIAPEAFDRLLNYDWPGNVRELQNAIEYSVVLADQALITVKELPREIQLPAALHEARAANAAASLNLEDQERQAILQALTQAHGNKKKAAAILGIHRPTLYNKMKHHGINLK
ncbi:two component, sigma54 specific, transcriptional regulator, Fis family [Chthoniobacter flavus Ellin428]|uniref:Two component, sigma54 specific, transcriptional regulator, Fis family n=1 Tax=Chthoniobacter flavus Ellin428 TaxID=497964 RepID=B4CU93_9BACT|nr:sigma-54 dependent transcriptional regulator [Chthoniobacter flavus]EDY22131.1 two component, sigma54 specific, transcriptional regulator, Fis family [Chthoniobacter flavus Ellin428]TCO94836.1 two-component system response regulator AtoC [Chthoniobacter flavus]